MFYPTPEERALIIKSRNCSCHTEDGKYFYEKEELCKDCQKAWDIIERYDRANEQAYTSQVDMACGYDNL